LKFRQEVTELLQVTALCVDSLTHSSALKILTLINSVIHHAMPATTCLYGWLWCCAIWLQLAHASDHVVSS